MAIRLIVKFPDSRLRSVAEPVQLFDEALRSLVDDLYDTMLTAPGIGITGPHIGVAKRVVVIQLVSEKQRRVHVNPTIVSASDEKIRHSEGSVSMPGVTEDIERSARVQVRYQDLDGAERTEDAAGLLAICLQNEID